MLILSVQRPKLFHFSFSCGFFFGCCIVVDLRMLSPEFFHLCLLSNFLLWSSSKMEVRVLNQQLFDLLFPSSSLFRSCILMNLGMGSNKSLYFCLSGSLFLRCSLFPFGWPFNFLVFFIIIVFFDFIVMITFLFIIFTLILTLLSWLDFFICIMISYPMILTRIIFCSLFNIVSIISILSGYWLNIIMIMSYGNRSYLWCSFFNILNNSMSIFYWSDSI